jgi:cobyrinic acid a,c-diamide synthase
LIIEAMMGLYDGAADGRGTPADLARLLDLAVVLVVDCSRMSQSVGALVRGFMEYGADLRFAGVILNRVASPRHETMLRNGLSGLDVTILGVIPQDRELVLPERHLGLVQAGEIGGIERFLDHAADVVEAALDVGKLLALAGSTVALPVGTARTSRIAPLGQRIAIARDEAFAFAYPHIIEGWRAMGAEISFFSPLLDDAPDIFSDAIYLPGGYPELHCERLAQAGHFREAMRDRATAGAVIYGECGGYMTLGDVLIDAEGTSWPMLGLLPVITSFADGKRHLGYRKLKTLSGPYAGIRFAAHEFHYSSAVSEGEGDHLFEASDATGHVLGAFGLSLGSTSGSYMHLVDLVAEAG